MTNATETKGLQAEHDGVGSPCGEADQSSELKLREWAASWARDSIEDITDDDPDDPEVRVFKNWLKLIKDPSDPQGLRAARLVQLDFVRAQLNGERRLLTRRNGRTPLEGLDEAVTETHREALESFDLIGLSDDEKDLFTHLLWHEDYVALEKEGLLSGEVSFKRLAKLMRRRNEIAIAYARGVIELRSQ